MGAYGDTTTSSGFVNETIPIRFRDLLSAGRKNWGFNFSVLESSWSRLAAHLGPRSLTRWASSVEILREWLERPFRKQRVRASSGQAIGVS